MVAGFNPDQLRQFQATRGLFESGMAFDPTQALQGLAQQQRPMTGQVGSLLTAPIEQYQSPFQQQVIDQALGDIQRQADKDHLLKHKQEQQQTYDKLVSSKRKGRRRAILQDNNN